MLDIVKDYLTQDIEFNSAPVIELADAKTTREIFELWTKYGGDKKELYKHLEARNDTDLQKARDQIPNKHLEVRSAFSYRGLKVDPLAVNPRSSLLSMLVRRGTRKIILGRLLRKLSFRSRIVLYLSVRLSGKII